MCLCVWVCTCVWVCMCLCVGVCACVCARLRSFVYVSVYVYIIKTYLITISPVNLFIIPPSLPHLNLLYTEYSSCSLIYASLPLCTYSSLPRSGNLIGPFNTPRISDHSTAVVIVTASVANGVVGFSSAGGATVLTVDEPDGRTSLTNRVWVWVWTIGFGFGFGFGQ